MEAASQENISTGEAIVINENTSEEKHLDKEKKHLAILGMTIGGIASVVTLVLQILMTIN
ncbi:MAG: hypothetical protein ATN32_06955 [Candidatus Epulonipiscium fishelsonii]|nr:MAG: hypothetical protein ATN32_06955 [Epulopiscium sp. AS2M-Bin002]